jgi:hypothetical protein
MIVSTQSRGHVCALTLSSASMSQASELRARITTLALGIRLLWFPRHVIGVAPA